VSLSQDGELAPEVVVFLNRLSDYLFVAARFACLKAGAAEEVYKKGRGVEARGGSEGSGSGGGGGGGDASAV
jgi:hypothetical protein